MNIDEITHQLNQAVLDFLKTYFPGIASETLQWGGGILLGCLALLLLLIGLRMLRPTKNRTSTRINIALALQSAGTVVDVLDEKQTDDILMRCVLTAITGGKIKCEIIERHKPLPIEEGNALVCQFAPMKTEEGKVNSFTSTVLKAPSSGRNADRLVLSVPLAYGMTPRRKHVRKRVADQQFIRVKLWATDPYHSDIPFQDAAPQVAVNSFTVDGPNQSSNAVINISAGGLGLSIQNNVIPETCAVGALTAINIFMFNFKERTFKPYWYVGTVRSMEEGRTGFTRIGLEFSGIGTIRDGDERIDWEPF